MRKRFVTLVAALSLLATFSLPSLAAPAASGTYTCTATLNGTLLGQRTDVPASVIAKYGTAYSYPTSQGTVLVTCRPNP